MPSILAIASDFYLANWIFFDKDSEYHGFSVERGCVELSSCLHRGVNVFVDDESLSSHSDVFLRDDLEWMNKYVEDFAVFLEGGIEGVFEFVDRYFFIQIVNVDGIIGDDLVVIIFYLVVGITYLGYQKSPRTFCWLGKILFN